MRTLNDIPFIMPRLGDLLSLKHRKGSFVVVAAFRIISVGLKYEHAFAIPTDKLDSYYEFVQGLRVRGGLGCICTFQSSSDEAVPQEVYKGHYNWLGAFPLGLPTRQLQALVSDCALGEWIGVNNDNYTIDGHVLRGTRQQPDVGVCLFDEAGGENMYRILSINDLHPAKAAIGPARKTRPSSDWKSKQRPIGTSRFDLA